MQSAFLLGQKQDKKKENKGITTMNIKSVGTEICFQEIPDEISLAFFISNCPNNCPGCHSPYLREDVGAEVLSILPKEIRNSIDAISCALFMGGDDSRQIEQLKMALYYCRAKGLKTALYSGSDSFPTDEELLWALDYVKVGSYREDLGGLKNPNTNQRLYKKQENGEWEDITYRFWSSPISP